MTREEWVATQREAERLLQHHHHRDRPSQSWRFGSLYSDGTMDGNLSYSVTWSPGTLTLAGDIGELVVTHYHAMPTIMEAATWMHQAEFYYIMEKSNAQQVFDQEGTFQAIVRMANETALDSLRHVRKVRHRYKRDCMFAEVGDEPDRNGYELEPVFRPYNFNVGGRNPPRWWPCIADRICEPPEGWELWFRLADELLSPVEVMDVLKAYGRRNIKEALQATLSDGEHRAAQLCSDLCIDDFHGCRDYKHQRMIQFVALQRWAEHVLQEAAAKGMALSA